MSDDNYLLDDGTYAGIGKSAFIDDDCPPLTAEELEFVSSSRTSVQQRSSLPWMRCPR